MAPIKEVWPSEPVWDGSKWLRHQGQGPVQEIRDMATLQLESQIESWLSACQFTWILADRLADPLRQEPWSKEKLPSLGAAQGVCSLQFSEQNV